jgi:hypothetical protein
MIAIPIHLRFNAFLMLAVVGACAPRPPAAPLPGYPNQARAMAVRALPQRLLAAHNAERSRVRAAPLAWDSALAAGAAAYARQLAASGTFRHSDRGARPGIGENLWMGTRGAFSPEQMVGNWASEKRWFVPGIFPKVSRSGRWSDVAHYTQIVWPATTRVGCAVASGRGREVLVCRYAPAGNIDGRRVP